MKKKKNYLQNKIWTLKYSLSKEFALKKLIVRRKKKFKSFSLILYSRYVNEYAQFFFFQKC